MKQPVSDKEVCIAMILCAIAVTALMLKEAGFI
jgi:hypothetical protein